MKPFAYKTLAEIEELQKRGLIERRLETLFDGTRELSFHKLRNRNKTWMDESSTYERMDVLMPREEFNRWKNNYHWDTMRLIESRANVILDEIRNA